VYICFFQMTGDSFVNGLSSQSQLITQQLLEKRCCLLSAKHMCPQCVTAAAAAATHPASQACLRKAQTVVASMPKREGTCSQAAQRISL
jgi:hypothetical protein